MWCTEDRCDRVVFDWVYSAMWHRSRCYVTFSDARLTWYESANMCIRRHGRLATFNLVNNSMKALLARHVPDRCAWLGLVKDYIHWIIPQSKFVVNYGISTDMYKYSPDAVPPVHAVSYQVAMDKPPPPKMATSSGLFLATIYNQSQLAERKHVARCWLINTAATAVLLSVHPSSLVITTKLAAAILGGGLFGGGVLPAQYCACTYI